MSKADSRQITEDPGLLTFDLDALAESEIVTLGDIPSPGTVSAYTQNPTGTGRRSWCSDNTATCTFAECCDR